ncbi:MAG: hypothetical protein ACRCST_13545 [Turicibacter sp.]
MAELLVNMALAYETYNLEEDTFRAKKNLLQEQYSSGMKKLKRDLITYKMSLKDVAGANGLDPNSPLVIAEMSKADALANDIETYGASTLSTQIGGLKDQVDNNLTKNLFSAVAGAGIKGYQDKLDNDRYKKIMKSLGLEG